MQLISSSKRILVFGDMHCPFNHPDALRFLTAVKRKYGPFHRVINLGDEIDAYSYSRFAKDPDALSSTQEWHAALTTLKKLYKLFPKVSVCISNHTMRPFKRAMEAGLPQLFMRSLKDVLEAPKGWVWQTHVNIDGVQFQHGDGYSGVTALRNAAIDNRCSTVMGHLHANAGISYIANTSSVIYGASPGCLVDQESYALAYSKTNRYKSVLGCLLITDRIPHILPMQLNADGKWNGRV